MILVNYILGHSYTKKTYTHYITEMKQKLKINNADEKIGLTWNTVQNFHHADQSGNIT